MAKLLLIQMAAVFCGDARVLISQTQLPTQSPRQAVIEMFTGGVDALQRHFTVEVQQKLKDPSNSTAVANPFSFLDALKGSGVQIQSFPTGPTLFVIDNPKQHKKLEVHLDSDELRGSVDRMELSFVSITDGKAEDTIAFQLSLGLKQQEDVWRLNTITASVKMPVGDPRFFDSALWNQDNRGGESSGETTLSAAGNLAGHNLIGMNSDAQPKAVKRKIPVVRAMRLIGLAENIYLQKHREVGFTCHIADLVNIGKGVEVGDTESSYSFLDPDFADGDYNGYRYTLTGCQGRPASSFHVIAEPLSGMGKAYCSDATHALRYSDDGRGSTCLLSGVQTAN